MTGELPQNYRDLLLTDAKFRSVAESMHRPAEYWYHSGVDVLCMQCQQAWPCTTRLFLDTMKRHHLDTPDTSRVDCDPQVMADAVVTEDPTRPPSQAQLNAAFGYARLLRKPEFRKRVRKAGYVPGRNVFVFIPGDELEDVLRRLSICGDHGRQFVALAPADPSNMDGWRFARIEYDPKE